jgi:hypothetical protein
MYSQVCSFINDVFLFPIKYILADLLHFIQWSKVCASVLGMCQWISRNLVQKMIWNFRVPRVQDTYIAATGWFCFPL